MAISTCSSPCGERSGASLPCLQEGSGQRRSCRCVIARGRYGLPKCQNSSQLCSYAVQTLNNLITCVVAYIKLNLFTDLSPDVSMTEYQHRCSRKQRMKLSARKAKARDGSNIYSLSCGLPSLLRYDLPLVRIWASLYSAA